MMKLVRYRPNKTEYLTAYLTTLACLVPAIHIYTERNRVPAIMMRGAAYFLFEAGSPSFVVSQSAYLFLACVSAYL